MKTTNLLCALGALALPWAAPGAMINIPIMGVGSIDVKTNGDVPMGSDGDIKATFTHTHANFAAAAQAACMGGHFNWVNIVRNMPMPGSVPNHPDTMMPVTAPWVDPLPGGTFGGGFSDPADKLPFYYEEKDAIPSSPEFDGLPVTDQIDEMAKTLMFFDRPENQPNTMWEFETYLVCVSGAIGQMDDMRFSVVAGFKWKFNEDAMDMNSITNLMTLDTSNNAAINMDLNTIMDGYMMLQDWEAVMMVPGPGAATLLAVSGVLVMGRRRR